MANEKLSQLTQITTPVGTDEMYIIQGGQSLSVTLTQLLVYIEPNLDSDNIPFDDTSSNGLISNLVGSAIRELDDDFDSYVNEPQLPEYAVGDLPIPSAVPRMMAFATNTVNGNVPVYSTGFAWRYFSTNDNVTGVIPSNGIGITTTAPTVVSS